MNSCPGCTDRDKRIAELETIARRNFKLGFEACRKVQCHIVGSVVLADYWHCDTCGCGGVAGSEGMHNPDCPGTPKL